MYNLIGDVEGKVAILVDDMIDTAGTLSAGAALLRKCVRTHPSPRPIPDSRLAVVHVDWWIDEDGEERAGVSERRQKRIAHPCARSFGLPACNRPD